MHYLNRYNRYMLNEPATQLPLHVFDARPPKGTRIVIMMIEVNESTPDNMLSIIFTGATYAYKDCLKEHGVAGGRLFQKYVQNGTYYHLMKNLDVGLDENRKKVIHVIERVFDSLVMRAKTSGKAAPQGSDTEAFIAELAEACPNLFFDKAAHARARAAICKRTKYPRAFTQYGNVCHAYDRSARRSPRPCTWQDVP